MAVKEFELEKVNFEWTTNEETNDCGVFLMKHMELFCGKDFYCPELLMVSLVRCIFSVFAVYRF